MTSVLCCFPPLTSSALKGRSCVVLAADVVGDWRTGFRDQGCGVDSGFQETEQHGSGLKFLQMPSAVFLEMFQ